jgi:Right handed beta helix region
MKKYDVIAWLPALFLAAQAFATPFIVTGSRGANYESVKGDFANFSSAVHDMSMAGKSIVINGPVTCNTLTIPANVALEIKSGGSITVAAGRTLTFNGRFQAGLYQVFAGSGAVVFGAGAIKETLPEWWQTNTIPGYTDMTAAIQSAANAFSVVRIERNTYAISYGITLPAGTTIVGDGKNSLIKQVTNATDTMTDNHLVSNYPMFRIIHPDCTFRGVHLQPKLDGIAAGRGGDHLAVDDCIIDSDTYTLFSGISWFGVDDVAVRNSTFSNCGAPPAWSGSANVYSIGEGLIFGQSHRVMIAGDEFRNSGADGIQYYGASDVTVANCLFYRNGMSGLQAGPHPEYTGLIVKGCKFVENYADGVDINWTGAGVVNIGASITGNYFRRNGFFGGDASKPTQDGSGIGTYRNVSHFSVTGNVTNDNRGAGCYITNANDFTLSDNVVDMVTVTDQPAVYMGGGIFAATVSGNILKAVASALQFGGKQDIHRLVVSHNVMNGLTGLVTPNDANFHDSPIEGNTITTTNSINVVYNFTGNIVSGLSPTNNLIYIGASGLTIEGNVLSSNSSGATVTAMNLDALYLISNKITNMGTGIAVNLNGCTNPVLEANRIIADNAGATALRLYSNGSNYCDNVNMSHNFIHSTAGTAFFNNFAPTVHFNNNTVSGTQIINGNAVKHATYR